MHLRFVFSAGLAAVLMAAFFPGCGMIADKDRIVVARYDDIQIRRGDLMQHLRNMDDAKRPRIRRRDDLKRVLEQYIDNAIKRKLGEQMEKEGVIKIPREVAREQFFATSGEDEQMYRTIWALQMPEDGAPTELMTVYNLTPDHVRRAKEIIELKTDDVLAEMRGDQAVAYLAAKEYREGTLKADEKDLRREYELSKDSLIKFEWMSFLALRFPASTDAGREEASRVRDRLDAGEDFDTLFEEYRKRNPSFVADSMIENNPKLARFRNFWFTAAGAQPGDILGPVYLPEFQQQSVDAQGKPVMRTVPESYMVLRVTEHENQRTLTLEEARPRLLPPLLYNAEMEKLRAEHGVEIYEDKLPNPSGYTSRFGDPIAG